MLNRKTYVIFVAILFTALLYVFTDGVILISWGIGLLFGWVLQKSRFCFASAFRDYVLFDSYSLLKTLLLTMIFTLVIFFGIQNVLPYSKGFPVGIFKPVGLHTAVGGLLFGLGMTISGGCITISLVRLGEGFLINFITLVSVIVGTILAILSHPLWGDFVLMAPKIYLPHILGTIGGVGVSVGILLLLYSWLLWKERSLEEMPTYVEHAATRSHVWTSFETSIALATLNGILLLTIGSPMIVSNIFPVWISKGLMLCGVKVQEFSFFKGYGSIYINHPFFAWETLFILGVVAGAFVSAYYYFEFRLKSIKSKGQMLLAASGGLLMGFGARLAIGCTTSTLLGGIASMSLHGWVFAIFLIPGVYLGVYLLQKLID